MSDATLDETRRVTPRKLAAALLLAALGGAVGFAFAWFTDERMTSWADELAAIVGLVCAAGAGGAAAAVLARKSGAKNGCAWLQVAAMALAGVMLLLPVLAPPDWPRSAVFAAVVVLFALQAAANLALWRVADELLRRVIVETGAACFWGLQAALFLYAAAERLGLTSGLSAWGLIAILMAVYLITSSVVAFRRGLN